MDCVPAESPPAHGPLSRHGPGAAHASQVSRSGGTACRELNRLAADAEMFRCRTRGHPRIPGLSLWRSAWQPGLRRPGSENETGQSALRVSSMTAETQRARNHAPGLR
jgi:hypothetical protein